jgi:hypothetical protein
VSTSPSLEVIPFFASLLFYPIPSGTPESGNPSRRLVHARCR